MNVFDKFNMVMMKNFDEQIKKGEKTSPPVLYKAFTFEKKEFVQESRSFLAIASSSSPDRMDDTVQVTGAMLDNYKRNPVLLWAHDHDIPSLGHALDISVTGELLTFRPSFATAEENPFADQIYRSYIAGHINAFSIGFMPMEYKMIEDQDHNCISFDITKYELLEISCVNVPAHPDALKLGLDKNTEWYQKVFKGVEQTSSFEDKFELLSVKIGELEKTIQGLIPIEEKTEIKTVVTEEDTELPEITKEDIEGLIDLLLQIKPE